MADDSKIEWTDATWPITVGCNRTAPKGSSQSGCGDASGGGCYAEQSVARVNRCQAGAGRPAPYSDLVKLVKRGDRTVARWTGKAKFFTDRLSMPLRWKRPRRIFVSSQSDLFHDDITNEQIAAVFGVMAASPRHSFQVLTKRARRMREWFEWVATAPKPYGGLPEYADHCHERSVCCRCAWMVPGLPIDTSGPIGLHPSDDVLSHQTGPWPLPNVWCGVSVENQAAADERIPELLRTPAAVRWISAEPLLGPVDVVGVAAREMARATLDANDFRAGGSLDWIVAGCESGPGARPCDVAWLRSLRDQCAAVGVPYFLKQAKPREPREGVCMGEDPIAAGNGSRCKAGGLIGLPHLDGVQHAAFPKEQQP